MHSLLLLSTLALVGCQALTEVSGPQTSGLIVDPYSGVIRYEGEMLTDLADDQETGVAVQIEKVFLSSEREERQPIRFFINVVNNYYSNIRILTYALDSSGEHFKAGWVTHQLNCSWNCGYNEVMQIELSPNYVLAHRLDGIVMKFYGAGNLSSNTIHVPPADVQALIAAIPLT